jgi:hypothetical protein
VLSDRLAGDFSNWVCFHSVMLGHCGPCSVGWLRLGPNYAKCGSSSEQPTNIGRGLSTRLTLVN